MGTRLTYNPVLCDRIFFSILFIFLPLINGQILGQDKSLSCSAIQSTIDAKPGSAATVSIKVTNSGNISRTLNSKLGLPQGWRQIIKELPFEIEAGKTDIRILSFSIPSDAPSGRYEIIYSVRDNSSPANEAAVTFIVNIIKIVQIDLQLMQAPRFSQAGTVFPTTILITNLGNSAGPVRLNCRSSSNFPVEIDSMFLNLAPKEVRQVQIYVKPEEKSEKVNHTLEIEATSMLDTTVRVRISSVVEIIPNVAKVEEEYIRFPVALRLREVGQDGKYSPQAEAFGYGSLSEDRKDRLEFLFRGPETQTKSTLGQRDEYRISYIRENFELMAGDQNYSLSTLTESARYASGFGGRAKFGGLSAGGFYNSTRWSLSDQKEIGGFINYAVHKNAKLGVNYLRKREDFSADIMSVQSLITPITGTTLELEYGVGEKNNKKDDAYAAQMLGSQKWISYNIRYIQSGANYGGYYRDLNYFSSSINFKPLEKLRIETYLRLEDRNLARDTNQVYAPHDVSYQIGGGFSDFFSIYYLSNFQEDRFDSSKYRTLEEAVQTRFGYSFPFASFYANMDFGNTRNQLNSTQAPYKRFSLSSSFILFGRQNYSTSVEYSDMTDTYSGIRQKRYSASLNAMLFLSESAQARLNIYGSRVNASVRQSYCMFEGALEQILPFNHKVSLHGRHIVITPSYKNTQDAVILEYEIPIGVPIKRITSVGQLSGTIINEQGKGIANVMVNVGDNKTLTDRDGTFYFGAIKPGTAFLAVDKASIGFDKITDKPIPLELTITGGEETAVTLRVSRSVTIAGDIVLYGSTEKGLTDTSSTIVELGGKPGVFLEITSATEMHRRVSDSRGKFMFNDIRPGEWMLKVIGGDIPAYHNVIPDSMKIILAPGERKDVIIQIKPRKRSIKMLEGNQPSLQLIPKSVAIVPPTQLPLKVDKNDSIAKPEQPHKICMITYDEKRKGFVLQISSWLTKKKADRVARNAVRISGLKTFKQIAYIPSIGRRYRVYIGNFKTREDAVNFCYRYDFDL